MKKHFCSKSASIFSMIQKLSSLPVFESKTIVELSFVSWIFERTFYQKVLLPFRWCKNSLLFPVFWRQKHFWAQFCWLKMKKHFFPKSTSNFSMIQKSNLPVFGSKRIFELSFGGSKWRSTFSQKVLLTFR